MNSGKEVKKDELSLRFALPSPKQCLSYEKRFWVPKPCDDINMSHLSMKDGIFSPK